MKPQNYESHRKYVAGYHLVTSILLLLFTGGAINNAIGSSDDNRYSAWLLVLLSPALMLIFWYLRAFALKAQDRAIRAEEQIRHYILTGKPLDNRLRTGQIVALRFASDEEFPQLAKKAADENIPAAEIKRAIKNWKADYHRV